jgi:hypothetical protein
VEAVFGIWVVPLPVMLAATIGIKQTRELSRKGGATKLI